MNRHSIESVQIPLSATLRQAAESINRNLAGIALVVDEEGRLQDTITDGDIRRAVLAGSSLDTCVCSLRTRRATSPYPAPVTATPDTPHAELLRLMQTNSVHQLPLLDEAGRVVGLVTRDDLLPEEVLPVQAMVMAGGFGTRLRPLTDGTPKPMLPLGGRPLLELIIEQLRNTGIQQVNVTTHYHPEKIKSHFGDGSGFGVELTYVDEDEPLGTAGALGLIAPPAGPLLVVNGDILTHVDYRAMLAFHREHEADLTVGVRQYDLQIPYGVVESDGALVVGVREKPMYNVLVNAGIYLLEPAVFEYVPSGQRLDMPELIQTLIAAGRRVVSFPIVEYWLDIGQHVDYRQAQDDVENGRMVR